jgi:hypothetical protein
MKYGFSFLLAVLIVPSLNIVSAQDLQKVCSKATAENKFAFKFIEGAPVQICSIAEYQQDENCFEFTVKAHGDLLDLNSDQYFDLAVSWNSGIPNENNYPLTLYANCGDDTFISVFESDLPGGDSRFLDSNFFSPGLTGLWVIHPGNKKNWAILQANRKKIVYSENGDMDKEYVQYFIMKFDPKHFKYKIVKKSKIRDSEYQPSDRRPAIPMPFKPKIIIDE